MQHLEIDFDFSEDQSRSFKMAENCIINADYGNDTEGEYLGNIMVNEVKWAIVVIDDSAFPTLVKASHILIAERNWRAIL